MDFVTLVRSYQHEGGQRTNEEYAALLGVHPSNLSRFYAGDVDKPWPILRGLVRAFPQAHREAFEFLSSDTPVLMEAAS